MDKQWSNRRRFLHRAPAPIGIAALATILLLSHTVLAAPVNIKLSGTMPAWGDVASHRISPDGQWVVYVADQQTDEARELYGVPPAMGTL